MGVSTPPLERPHALLAEHGLEQYHFWVVSSLILAAFLYFLSSRDIYKPLPFIGHLHSVVGRSQQAILEWMLLASKHFEGKPWRLEVPTIGKGWFVNDAATLKYVLTTKHTHFSKGRFFTERTKDLFGSGILLATGDSWRTQRSTASVLINASNLETFGDEVLPNQLQVLLEPLSTAADTGDVIDLSEITENFSLAVFGQLAFNSEWTDLKTGFSTSFKAASGRIADRFHLPAYSIFEALTSRGSRLRDDLNTIQQYTRRMVQRAKSNIADEQLGKKTTSGCGTLLRALLEEDLGMTDRQIADCCLNLITAGVDTTAQALTWTLYLLLRHPHSLPPLRAEIDRLSPEKAVRTADLASQLPFMKAVIDESLRLHPPIPLEILENVSGESILLPNGRIVHSGEQIMWSSWVMARLSPASTARDESTTTIIPTWGDDPEQFRPERWLEMKHKPSTHEWPVFHAGPRACLGQSLARLELVYALKQLLERFDFEMAWDGTAKGVGKGLTAPIEGGLPARVRRRK